MLIKICGLTRADDMRASVDAGADLVGINLWSGSKRYVAPADVPPLMAAAHGAQTVAVLVDPSDAEIESARALGFDWLQLHGNETPERCRAIDGRWLKAIRLDSNAALAAVASYSGPLLLVDAPSSGYGGSGRLADWTLAERAARMRPMLLAGGLTPDNVAAAITAVRPAGVDVASGVERAPRQKDSALIVAFIDHARRIARAVDSSGGKE